VFGFELDRLLGVNRHQNANGTRKKSSAFTILKKYPPRLPRKPEHTTALITGRWVTDTPQTLS
jgi:hypothetical protein